MARWQFDRGEWTEAYVFMRLLGEGRIYGASSHLTTDDSVFIKMGNIIGDETNQILIFKRFVDDQVDYIKASKDDNRMTVVTVPEVSEYAQFLYDCVKMRASSRVTSMTKDFSVNNHVGSPATLFNCSQTSGFTFEVVGCDEASMHQINSKDAFLSIMDEIRKNYSLKYVGCRNETFEQNIAIVDSRMEEILSSAVLAHASYYGTCGSDVKKVCNKVIELNPIHMKNPHIFYPAKFKDFLFASFAGMTASSVWNGRKKLTGGYIDVSRSGDMLYYRAMSDDIFGNYLFENTYLDRPDRGMCKDLALIKANAYIEGRTLSEEEVNACIYKDGKSGAKKSKKGDFGYVYENNGHYYIDLNFQVRFR